MSPRKPVETLRASCTKSIVVWLLDAVKSNGDKCVDQLRCHFKKVPKVLRETILADILQLTQLNSFSKWVSFRILPDSCSKFEARNLSWKFHQRFIEELENVVYLNLTDAKTDEQTLITLIRKSPCLRALYIPNSATDSVLQEISALKHLELLDISGKLSLTRRGLAHLTNASLQILIIGNVFRHPILPRSDGDAVVQIIGQLPNLKEIRSYEYCGRALKSLSPTFVSKLIAIRDSDTDMKQIRAIINACPMLEQLSLIDPNGDVFEELYDLGQLKKLKILRVGSVSLRKLVLEELAMRNCTIKMDELCLTLSNLQLKSCSLVFRSAQDFSRFKLLRVVEFIDCNVNEEAVFAIMDNCNLLQRLAVSNNVDLTDDDIHRVCQKGKLQSLKELWLSLALKLTSSAVIMLMNHCEKLTLIGTLNGWNIDKIELNYLRCVIYFANIDLKLLYFNCF